MWLDSLLIRFLIFTASLQYDSTFSLNQYLLTQITDLNEPGTHKML